MKQSSKQPLSMNGAVTIEYMIVALLLMIPLWYGLVGGSGNWSTPNRAGNNGNLYVPPSPTTPYPGLVNVLDNRQRSFSQALNRP